MSVGGGVLFTSLSVEVFFLVRGGSLIQVCSDIDRVMVGGGASVAHGEGGDEEVAL